MEIKDNGRFLMPALLAPLLLTAALLVSLAAPVDAAIIDSWVTTQTESTPPAVISSTVTGPGILGGTRNVSIATFGADDETELDIGVAEPGRLWFNVDVGAAGNVGLSILWAGADPLTGLGGVDITDGGAAKGFRVPLRADSSRLEFGLFVTDTTGNQGELLLELPGMTDETFFFKFTAFIGAGEPVLVDMTSVNAILIQAFAPPGTELHLDALLTVSEPPSLALFALALLALFGPWGWRTRRST